MEACSRCGRTMLEVRADVGVDALRGAAPLCPVRGCPLVARVVGSPSVEASGRDLVGATPPAVFVGRHGYPTVNVGPLLAPGLGAGEAAPLADTGLWGSLGIADVLALRARLVRGKRPVDARRPLDLQGRVLETARQIALAERAVDAEVTLSRPARLALAPALDGTAAPMGPGVEVVDARLTSNPSVPRRVDAAVGDVHARAGDVMREMHDAGVPLAQVQRVLSVGLLGEERRRRLVPTRWAITATDDVVGRAVAERVRALPEGGETVVHFGELHGNRFHVALLPAPWSFEMHEVWEVGEAGRRRVQVASDAEGHRGRTAYADNITGAYYAARLSVLEHLESRAKRQAAALVLREITDAYWAPLGVWVIRDGVAAALAGKGLAFGSGADAWRHVLRKARFRDAAPAPALLAAGRQARLDRF